MPSLDFYTSGATEKRAFIGEFTNLLTVRTPWHYKLTQIRQKVARKSLDSFAIIKAPAVGLDSPSIAPLKENDKEISLSLPSGDWEAIAVTFPDVKDPLVLRKSGPNASGYKWGSDYPINPRQSSSNPNPWGYWSTNWKSDRSYAIQGTTTSSPIVAVFTKKRWEEGWWEAANYKQGDEPAPTVDIPEYTDPIELQDKKSHHSWKAWIYWSYRNSGRTRSSNSRNSEYTNLSGL